MNCRKFESQLEMFLSEKLPLASMRECRAHMESCAPCRELMELATRELIQVEPARTEELVQAVLEKTSGKSCSHSHEWLPDYVDGALAAASKELIERHLENCSSCQQIHQTLRELKQELPVLAQMDPGSSFTRECMSSFRQLQNQLAPSKIRFGRIWHRLLARPRLAWESAYVLTLMVFVLIRLFAFIPGLPQMEAISDLQAKPARLGVSMAGAVEETFKEWSLSLTDRQDRWAKAFLERKEELLSVMTFMSDKSRQYSRSASNVIVKFPHSVWNGIVDKFEKILPKDKTAT